MKWFRSNIRHGSRLALLALAIQFVLAFGHFHGVAAEAAPALQAVSAKQSLPAQSAGTIWDLARIDGLAAPDKANPSAKLRQPAPDHDSDQQSNDGCAICAVIAMANAVLFATPPLLMLPQAVEFLYLTTDAEFVHLHSASVAFQPRAPPIS
jgi:hypothetical protein